MDVQAIDMTEILSRLAQQSSRPRYAFMVLNLLSEAAGHSGRAGPYVVREGRPMPVRDWLCDALAPITDRAAQRRALVERVRAELADTLPDDPAEAERIIDAAVRARVRASARPNISRAVSDLVRAGLVRRHYQGWRTNHPNRGAGRQAVYTVSAEALAALRRGTQLV